MVQMVQICLKFHRTFGSSIYYMLAKKIVQF
jgi:hypothetical protein